MPANLTPDYLAADKQFRAAKTTPEKITCLEEMLSVMPKHKGTDHLRAELRTRLAKLTQLLDKKAATQRASMMIEKTGAAQIAVIGLPNAGKSQLVARLTKATPVVAAYPFSTHNALPGMMEFENIQIQLIDTPPLSDHPPEWWLIDIIKRADGLFLVVDLSQDPEVEADALIGKLAEKRIGIDTETECQEGESPVVHKKALLVGNKKDLDTDGRNYRALHDGYADILPVIAVSALGEGLEEFRVKIFEMMDIIRVYTKPPGGKPDMSS
ncbi:MAG: 50S ribosome-binding GTPase, partial [Dehalococcoidales bacterium]|nr:50S ribosome-binding GTPase [Dehalococcoidales bacterium]